MSAECLGQGEANEQKLQKYLGWDIKYKELIKFGNSAIISKGIKKIAFLDLFLDFSYYRIWLAIWKSAKKKERNFLNTC